MHQIGEAAEAVGLSLRTIRYYEETGLVPPSGRSSGGFRLYTDADIERLRLVKSMKPLDLTIEEMRELLSIRDGLAGRTASRRERDRLVERLQLYATLAEERCARLHDQLAVAQALSAALRSEVANARDKVRTSR
jgi:DNA-binding transcriptional MerR regulator